LVKGLVNELVRNRQVCQKSLKLRQQGRGFYTNGEPLPPSLLVTVEQGFGLSASFSCARLEVVAAERPPSGPIGGPQS
jgi:hypothetical protein